ncbi:hypothetical protein JCM10207_003019 [Rhodosporidiobolus poonsookiae]
MSLRTALASLARPLSTSARRLAVPSSSLPPPASQWTLPKGLALTGTVIRAGKMQHTVTVSVERRMTDHKTLKEFSKHTKYLVHDPAEQCVVGDQVEIRNCRPISARKRFELVSVVKGARERVESKQAEAAHDAEGAALAQA